MLATQSKPLGRPFPSNDKQKLLEALRAADALKKLKEKNGGTLRSSQVNGK